jgi:hypothetical protein
MAENLANLRATPVYVPYAMECQGNIVQVFDPVYHLRVEEPAATSVVISETVVDGRWAKCKRPFLMTGGELTLDMLDLSYNPTSKIYDAPFQLKANNGIYLIDDFGRQRATPAEVLNRWIVPMERRQDYLSFRSGGKMTVPFECFLVFSTNLNPSQLGDEAFLRRIHYKLHLHGPSEAEFIDIFRRYCASKGLASPEGLIARLIARRYRPTSKPFRRCHPRDLISHAIDMMQFQDRAYVLTDELLDEAFASCFVEESESDAASAEPWRGPDASPESGRPEPASAEPEPLDKLVSIPMPGGKPSLAAMQSVFGKLLYISSLRDPATGRYSDPRLAAEADADEADRQLRSSHAEAFRDWLTCTLGHQKSDLDRYLISLAETKRAAVKGWLRSRAYQDLIPSNTSEQDRRLYLADMESLVHMLFIS